MQGRKEFIYFKKMSQKNNKNNRSQSTGTLPKENGENPAKLNTAEFEHFKKHIDIERRLVLKMGELEIDKRNVMAQQDKIDAMLMEKQKTFNQWLIDFIHPKYGECDINPVDGTIIPIAKPDKKDETGGGK